MRRDIRAVLERWGRWAAHEENRSDWPTVCATFRGVLPHKSSLPRRAATMTEWRLMRASRSYTGQGQIMSGLCCTCAM
ncbi:hypothetical protein DYJ26_19350 [Salmonella enterica]|nr:hypothetical protein [Salmonella enterica]EBL0007098.1 hypothetical protein [Salmonella enterica]